MTPQLVVGGIIFVVVWWFLAVATLTYIDTRFGLPCPKSWFLTLVLFIFELIAWPLFWLTYGVYKLATKGVWLLFWVLWVLLSSLFEVVTQAATFTGKLLAELF